MATLSSSKRVSYLLSMLSLLYIFDSLSLTFHVLKSQYLFYQFSVFRIRSTSILVLLSFYDARLILDSILLTTHVNAFLTLFHFWLRRREHNFCTIKTARRSDIHFSVVRLFQHLSSEVIDQSFTRKKPENCPVDNLSSWLDFQDENTKINNIEDLNKLNLWS